MSTATKTAKTFVEQFVAFIEGDDAAAKAAAAKRQAIAGLKTQLSNMEGDSVDKEQIVEDKKLALTKAKVNGGQPITDRPQYVRNLLSAKNAITEAEDALALHLETIAFLKDTLESI